MVAETCDPSTEGAEAGGLGVQSQLTLHSRLKSSLAYTVRSCLKATLNQNQSKEQAPNPDVDKMGLGESGSQKPLPEGGWCQVQARQYRETAVTEIKAHTLPVSGTCLSLPWLHIKAHAGLQTPSVPFHEYLLCISKSTPASWPFSPLYLNSQAHPDHRLPSPQLLLS